MSRIITLRLGVALAATGLVAFAAVPAQAEAVPADSSGSVGAAQALYGTEAIDIGPLAPCAAGGPGIGTTAGQASDAGLVSYGPGSSTCTYDPSTNSASATINGRQFQLNKNNIPGVPSFSVATYTVSCTTTDTGVTSSISLNGVKGLQVPDDIPPDYTITVPGLDPDGPPIARIVLNDTVKADPPDTSLSVHAIKIWLYPDTGAAAPGSGSITVGSVTCNPAHLTEE
ncbi:hypothetical protein [Actinokineospora inagensis]|uniref:hypothetical protein n=1 Tax=Actinokineospora inagensis TaxID=103730 RepID=UPI000405CCA5|nr:hypothetical protein [Actinokineospora inagensis]